MKNISWCPFFSFEIVYSFINTYRLRSGEKRQKTKIGRYRRAKGAKRWSGEGARATPQITSRFPSPSDFFSPTAINFSFFPQCRAWSQVTANGLFLWRTLKSVSNKFYSRTAKSSRTMQRKNDADLFYSMHFSTSEKQVLTLT